MVILVLSGMPMNRLNVWISVVIFVHIAILKSYGKPEEDTTPQAKPTKPSFAGQYAFVGTVDMPNGRGSDDICIVTAVTEKWVLTVYSCFLNLLAPGENLTVFTLNMAAVSVSIPNFILNQNDIGEKKLPIDKIIIGDDFGEDRVVLIRLATPISKDLLSKVKLNNHHELDPKSACITLGWRPIYYPGFNSSEDQSELQDIPIKASIAKPGADDFINGTVLGQFTNTTKPQGICKFESGSPLLCEADSVWNFVGVAGDLGEGVRRNECQSTSKHTVYISLEPYVTWIVSQIRETDEAENKTEKKKS